MDAPSDHTPQSAFDKPEHAVEHIIGVRRGIRNGERFLGPTSRERSYARDGDDLAAAGLRHELATLPHAEIRALHVDRVH